MTYISKTDDKYSRNKLDLERFGKDLANALGGQFVSVDPQYQGGYAKIRVGNEMIDISFSPWKGTASISIEPIGLKFGEYCTYAADQKIKSITINPDGRKIEAIAKDVRKRVIDANAPAIIARRAYAVERRKAREQIALVLGRLKESCPSLSISKRQPEDESATFYNSDPYMSGTVDSDGKIRIERIESMTLAQFAAIMEVMQKV